MPSRSTTHTKVTNPAATRLPKPLGQFGQPSAPEPISKKPRARLGERLDGQRVEITNQKGTRTTKAKGGSA